MWLPLVRRFTSAARSSSAPSGVTPAPLATFSALATTRSMPWRPTSRGTRAFTAWRPGLPNTSPRKRSFTARASSPAPERVSTAGGGGPRRAGRGRADHPPLRDHRVERGVVRLARHLAHELRLVGQADAGGPAGQAGQGGVVVAPSAAEAKARRVEGHTRHEDEVDLLEGHRGRGQGRLARPGGSGDEIARRTGREGEARQTRLDARPGQAFSGRQGAAGDLGRVHLRPHGRVERYRTRGGEG